MAFAYTYDQVVEAIASTRGDATHFFLLEYLHTNAHEVGPDRFRSLLKNAPLRGQDAVGVHVELANLDPEHARRLPTVLKSLRSLDSQQVLVLQLPDVIPHRRNEAVADQLARWIRRRVARPSYLEFGASWEVPSAVLTVLHTSDGTRARTLLEQLKPDLDDVDSERVDLALAQADDEALEEKLYEWRSMNGAERPKLTPPEQAEADAETEREAARLMRRLGVRPSG